MVEFDRLQGIEWLLRYGIRNTCFQFLSGYFPYALTVAQVMIFLYATKYNDWSK